jgi:hypothetical protein
MLVDLRAIWSQEAGEFTKCFFPAAFLANLAYMRCSTRLSLLIAVLAALAMTALLIVTVPLSLFFSALLSVAIPGVSARPDSATAAGLIVTIVISALISSAAQSALLRLFKHRVTLPGFLFLVLLNLVCLALAGARTAIDVRPAIA